MKGGATIVGNVWLMFLAMLGIFLVGFECGRINAFRQMQRILSGMAENIRKTVESKSVNKEL